MLCILRDGCQELPAETQRQNPAVQVRVQPRHLQDLALPHPKQLATWHEPILTSTTKNIKKRPRACENFYLTITTTVKSQKGTVYVPLRCDNSGPFIQNKVLSRIHVSC